MTFFGSPGTNRPRTGPRNSSTILSRGPCTPAPGTPSTMGSQVASACSVPRMASRSPVLSVRKKSTTTCSCALRAVIMCPPLTVLLLGRVDFREGLARDARAVDAGRHTAVHRHLQDHFADLLARQSIVQRGLHMQLQFVRPVQCADHRDVDQAAVAQCEAWSSPHMTPAIFGGELLHGHAETVGAGHGFLHVFRTQHLLAQLQSFLEFLVRHYF